jgi:flagellar secretion chaperone FliS
MRVQSAYRKQRAGDITRIDTILGLYDHALDRIEKAEAAVARQDQAMVRILLNKAQFAISGLVCGVQGHADDLSLNFLRLYEFVVRQLAAATPEGLQAAKQVLRTLREGFETARPEALRLEREGLIPPLGAYHSIQVTG